MKQAQYIKNADGKVPFVAQGDVRIFPIDSLPEGAKKVKRECGRVILAAGEVTGHHHAIATPDCDLYELNGEMFIHVNGPATVVHEEHGAHDLAPGFYKAAVDCEYTPAEIKKVRD